MYFTCGRNANCDGQPADYRFIFQGGVQQYYSSNILFQKLVIISSVEVYNSLCESGQD